MFIVISLQDFFQMQCFYQHMTCRISSRFHVLKKSKNMKIIDFLLLYHFFLNLEKILFAKIITIDVYSKNSNLKVYQINFVKKRKELS
jgi:hypothetical protein